MHLLDLVSIRHHPYHLAVRSNRWVVVFILLAFLIKEPMRVVSAGEMALSRDGKAAMPVVVSPNVSEDTRKSAQDLVRYLGQISGGEFVLESGDGSKGIVVGLATDFSRLPFKVEFENGLFGREEYLLRSTESGLYLIGASEMAVSHAVWDTLHRLGYRQFFPGDTWEVVPKEKNLHIEVDVRGSPSFHARRIWYNWGLWGYNEEPYRQWCARNRAVQGFRLDSGHAYDAIVAAQREEFEKHPEYLAEVGGERKIRPDVKFCISNPGLRKLVVNWAVEKVRKSPERASISMEPSDGGGWCECKQCAQIGSISDRVVLLANEVAEAINALGLGPRYVGLYAYNQHCAPPNVRVHPKVIPSATTAFLTGGLTFDQVLQGWQGQGATMGVYDYLSVVDWDWNLPRGAAASRPKRVADLIARIHRQGARFYDAESGDCWGPAGLGYYVASRVLWDVREAARVDAITEDFIQKAFGSAREPMREFYRLITEDTQLRSPADMVGRMYRQLEAARAATTDDRVLRRIDDLILYTRYAELYYSHANGGTPKEVVAAYAYRIRKTMMVHSYGLWARLLSQQAAHTEGHPLKNETPHSPQEIAEILKKGIEQNQPVEPGFAGVEFSKDLVPAMPSLKLAKVEAGNFPGQAQDRQRYFVWMNEPGKVELNVTVRKVWANRMPKLQLFSPMEVSLQAVDTREDYQSDGVERLLPLKTPYTGLHRIEAYDGGDYTRIIWPKGMQVTVESGIDTSEVTSQFRGEWTLYFYVPKGTRVVGGWASRVANWAPRISGRLLNSSGKEMLDFAKMEGDGFFKVVVPQGADGSLWKFDGNLGQRLLMTVPPYLARRGEELLLPREVVERDLRN